MEVAETHSYGRWPQGFAEVVGKTFDIGGADVVEQIVSEPRFEIPNGRGMKIFGGSWCEMCFGILYEFCREIFPQDCGGGKFYPRPGRGELFHFENFLFFRHILEPAEVLRPYVANTVDSVFPP
jgi:hypothetical protein